VMILESCLGFDIDKLIVNLEDSQRVYCALKDLIGFRIAYERVSVSYGTVQQRTLTNKAFMRANRILECVSSLSPARRRE
jgi:hypothetical protein